MIYKSVRTQVVEPCLPPPTQTPTNPTFCTPDLHPQPDQTPALSMCQLAYDVSYPACSHRRYDEQSITPCSEAAICATKPDHFKDWLCRTEQGPCPDCQIRIRRDAQRQRILAHAAELSRVDLDKIKAAEKDLDERIREAEENAQRSAEAARQERATRSSSEEGPTT